MKNKKDKFLDDNYQFDPTREADEDLEDMLYAKHVEIKDLSDLEKQRGTPIPALYNQFYKFIQNPSTVSVETFKRMIDTEEVLGSGVDFLTTCLMARMGEYQHKSKEISEWVNKALEEIDNGFYSACKEMLSATWAGFSISEKVYGNTDLGFVPKKIVTLPPGTILFETDRTGELTEDGILQYQRNYNPALFGSGTNYLFGFAGLSGISPQTSGIMRPDPYAKFGDMPFPLRTANTYSYLSIRIPKQKVIHYSHDCQGKFGNPYGRSLLRRSYKYYVSKDTILTMMTVALDRKGTPLTVVYANPNVTLLDGNKVANQGANSMGRGDQNAGIRADIAAKKAFENVHNDTTIILPGKKGEIFETDFVDQNSNVNDFISALDFCNRSMVRALLIPGLIFGGDNGPGSFALGSEHAKTFDKILDGTLIGFKQVLLRQMIKEMLQYNFPESAWKKDGFGEFRVREVTQEERQQEMDIVDKGVSVGAIDMNDLKDLNTVREKMGFSPVDKIIKKPLPEGKGGLGDLFNLDKDDEPKEEAPKEKDQE